MQEPFLRCARAWAVHLTRRISFMFFSTRTSSRIAVRLTPMIIDADKEPPHQRILFSPDVLILIDTADSPVGRGSKMNLFKSNSQWECLSSLFYDCQGYTQYFSILAKPLRKKGSHGVRHIFTVSIILNYYQFVQIQILNCVCFLIVCKFFMITA